LYEQELTTRTAGENEREDRMMDCPRCKLTNPDTAQRCDCGYIFATNSGKNPRLVEGLSYDENILRQHAGSLYQQAKWIIFWTATKYGVVVFIISLAFGITVGSQKQIGSDTANSGMALLVFLTLVGIAAGVDAGRRKSFHLKLQAQQVLCQRQIEINTRP
jgi:hypothetical protein